MSNLEDPRIKVVKSVDEAEELVAQEFAHLTPAAYRALSDVEAEKVIVEKFAHLTPISYRGIVASVDGPVPHRKIRFEQRDGTVKDIDQILIDGTEKDVNDYNPRIRVIAFEFSKFNMSGDVHGHPMWYIRDLKQEAGLPPEEMKKLRFTVLAYDSTVINHLGKERYRHTMTLPLAKEQRVQAILRAYVVD
ncbi:hypothetical protein KY343_01770 [Candidatus Woesearchaeota archaeon]|nr:hypothetical protein [Candidatus Woesearchaeota archaeon]